MRPPLLQFLGTILMLLLVSVSEAASQTTIEIEAARDNTLYEDDNGLLSNGAGGYLFTGRTDAVGGSALRRALIHFDLDGHLSSSAVITSVEVRLTSSVAGKGTQNISLHRVLGNWGEGTSNAIGQEGAGAAATAGDATWLHSSFQDAFWNVPGGDFDAVVSSSASVTTTQGPYTWPSTDQLVEDVQAWVETPEDNFGWTVVGNESGGATAKRFFSRETATAANRPTLIVTFVTDTDAEEEGVVPARMALSHYPNPFSGRATISFELPSTEVVRLDVYDLLGRRMGTLVNDVRQAGRHTTIFQAEDLPRGVYVYRLTAGSDVETGRMLLVR